MRTATKRAAGKAPDQKGRSVRVPQDTKELAAFRDALSAHLHRSLPALPDPSLIAPNRHRAALGSLVRETDEFIRKNSTYQGMLRSGDFAGGLHQLQRAAERSVGGHTNGDLRAALLRQHTTIIVLSMRFQFELHSSFPDLPMYPPKAVRMKAERHAQELLRLLDPDADGAYFFVTKGALRDDLRGALNALLAHLKNAVPEGRARALKADQHAPRREFVIGLAEELIGAYKALLSKEAREAIRHFARWVGYRSDHSIDSAISEGERRGRRRFLSRSAR